MEAEDKAQQQRTEFEVRGEQRPRAPRAAVARHQTSRPRQPRSSCSSDPGALAGLSANCWPPPPCKRPQVKLQERQQAAEERTAKKRNKRQKKKVGGRGAPA
jgi:hypothetical protein